MDLIAEQTMGYNKDKIASVIFFIAFFFVYFSKNFNMLKPLVLSFLFIAFFVDLAFTLNPKFHFVPMGYNLPSYVVCIGAMAALFVVFFYRKNIRL